MIDGVPSPVVFFQIATPDLAAAREFYGALFGWEFTEEVGGGVGIDPHGPGDFDVHGALRALPPGSVPNVTLWVRVGDLRATFEQAQALGADVLVPIRQAAPGGLHFGVIRCPDGQPLAIVQA